VPGLIDVHAHHYPDAYLEACKRADSGFTHYYRDDGRLIVLQDGGVALAVPQPLPPPEQRITMMDDAGVDVQLLSVSAPNVFRFPESMRIPLARDVNDEFVDITAASNGRLRMFASLPASPSAQMSTDGRSTTSCSRRSGRSCRVAERRSSYMERFRARRNAFAIMRSRSPWASCQIR
jgi:hypothetical protein